MLGLKLPDLLDHGLFAAGKFTQVLWFMIKTFIDIRHIGKFFMCIHAYKDYVRILHADLRYI